MKRVVPLIVISIALSVIVSRLAAAGRFATIRAWLEESCNATGEPTAAEPPVEAVAA